jgi:hypothetical protein
MEPWNPFDLVRVSSSDGEINKRRLRKRRCAAKQPKPLTSSALNQTLMTHA